MKYLSTILLCTLLAFAACGGGGGNSSDLSCAPAQADRTLPPTYDLDTYGTQYPWRLTLTYVSHTGSSGCIPAQSIVCDPVTMDVNNDTGAVVMSADCLADGSVAVTVGNVSGVVSGAILYWGATMSATVGDYTETDTVPCQYITFSSDSLSETKNINVTSVWSYTDGTNGTCNDVYSAVFTP